MITSFAQLNRMSERELLESRMDLGADQSCLFLPFVGEFGHEIMSHIRLVHFHRAKKKVVCCRKGNEVLYPSANQFVTDWADPFPDFRRIGTMRNRVLRWPELCERFPKHQPIRAGGLTLEQELMVIRPGERIPFKPNLRGLRADVVLGVRQRQFQSVRNWKHWQTLANAISGAGMTFAVMGRRDTSLDLEGQSLHTSDYDTDAAIELLQTCKLYVGTDSGGSHLAAAVGAPMLIFREGESRSRDLTGLMAQANPGRVSILENGWGNPDLVAERAIELCHAPAN